ncbi:MAG: hypothetical protein ACFFC7_22995 [Candidatus Hermodarchaeota archaeon]
MWWKQSVPFLFQLAAMTRMSELHQQVTQVTLTYAQPVLDLFISGEVKKK